MRTIRKHTPQYVTDSGGKKTAVILPIDEYNELIEDLYDLAVVAERRDEPSIPHHRIVADLKKDGYL
jgi:PHD/YefM family antitoxin component YafN of YafNO toxin-antitoxin module